jgi:ribosomal protein L32E
VAIVQLRQLVLARLKMCGFVVPAAVRILRPDGYTRVRETCVQSFE